MDKNRNGDKSSTKEEPFDFSLVPETVNFLVLLARSIPPDSGVNFSSRTPQEKKDRIQFLWKRVRIVSMHQGLLKRLLAEA